LINDYSLSPVSWTLICELHFYLLIAVLLFFKINAFLRIAIINLLFLFYYCLIKIGFLNASVGALIGEFFYFCWMSLGAAIYMVYKRTEGECKEKNFILLLATAVVVYFEYQLALNNTFGFPVFSDSDTISLASAFAIFVTFIFVNPYYSDKLSNFLGNISYPLYCLHFPVGWVIHYFLISNVNFNPLMSLFFVMLIVIFLSYVVHLYVEKPANILGKKISEKFNEARLN
jgi:peptidoglycan/LPS O-acetylase OafA/YrhL